MKKVYYLNFKTKPIEIGEGLVEFYPNWNEIQNVTIQTQGEEIIINKQNICYSFKEAEEKLTEYKIIKEFKNNNEHVCKYCGKHIIDTEDLTVDHVIPRSKGGKTISNNLIISCKSCNQDKSDIEPFRYVNCKVKSQYKKESRSRRGCKKVGRNLNLKADNVEYLAKKDSNIWDLKTFFNKNPYKIANEIGC